MVVYRGSNAQARFVVTRDRYPFSPLPSQRLYNHSPDGFAWGYGGSGPSQLALALLLDVTREENVAWIWYQTFKCEVVAGWPIDGDWDITNAAIWAWLRHKDPHLEEVFPNL